MDTFGDPHLGTGMEDPNLFNPTSLDCSQWVKTARDAGFRGIVLTAKHHDGFCLWPSALSTHTVARSPWREGRGDVLRELSDACRGAGLKFGVYLSPWDRNHPAYGTPEYNHVFAGMLEEVLSRYGPVFEVWFDGANGEGPNGRRQVYDWPLYVATVRRLQPDAVIFSDAGPDVRWVGNERGEGGPTSWSLIDRARYEPGTPLSAELTAGSPQGPDWVPPECDVSIRPGWFYRPAEDARVKTPGQLAALYDASVGRNCQLLLNVPPDRRGLIADPDAQALSAMRRLLDARYDSNRLTGAAARADTSLGDGFEVDRVLDGRADTYWAAAPGAVTGTLTFTLPTPVEVDRLVIQEPIEHRQRIRRFSVDGSVEGGWRTIGEGTTVGYKRILTVPAVHTDRIRLRIADARAQPLVSEVAVY
jgi:alpha-L-fucosidase